MEGEEELLAQLAADSSLPAAWATLLADEAEVQLMPCRAVDEYLVYAFS